MAISFEEYMEKANKARTVDELLEVFLEAVKQHGYDKMIFCLLSDHKQIGLAAGVGHLRNYPADWMKYYFEQGFDQLDPVISYCYQKLGTFTWQEMSERLDLTRKQKLCLNLGTEAGLYNGICTPLWGPHRFAGVGLASSEKNDACDGNIDMITAYCNHFYIAFQRLHAPPKNPDNQLPNIYLTAREKEVLTMIAEGKSDPVIAILLKLTPSGVDFHMRNIYKKMQINSRTYAISIAIDLGLIHPVLHPYISASSTLRTFVGSIGVQSMLSLSCEKTGAGKMIEFVTVENMHQFPGNALADQHRLRYRSIIERQEWDVPNYDEMEFDQYDNPAAKYLVYRDNNHIARGVSRFYPTTLPYMLEQLFSRFVTDREIPKSPRVWEGSRFCIDQTLPPPARKRIAQEIVVAYLETGLRYGIDGIVGLMYPAYWRSLFTSAGWDIKYMGETTLLDDGNKARAAWLPVSESVLARVRRTTGIHETIVNFGDIDVKARAA